MAFGEDLLDILREGIARTRIVLAPVSQVTLEKQLRAGLLYEALVVRLQPLNLSTPGSWPCFIIRLGAIRVESRHGGDYLLRLRDHLPYGVEVAMRRVCSLCLLYGGRLRLL